MPVYNFKLGDRKISVQIDSIPSDLSVAGTDWPETDAWVASCALPYGVEFTNTKGWTKRFGLAKFSAARRESAALILHLLAHLQG